jgi:hypothetical protein
MTEPRIMDRLEQLQANLPPAVALFTGVFPQSKGQQKRQILWVAERRDLDNARRVLLFGVESEINLIPHSMKIDCQG